MDNDGFTIVDLAKTAYRYNASLYIEDNKTKGRLLVVMHGKIKIIGVEGVLDEQNYKYYL